METDGTVLDTFVRVEEEKILVKPSTELISDEYEHIIDNKISINVFVSDGPHRLMASPFLDELEKVEGSSVEIHGLKSWEQIENDLNKIRDQPDMKALIIIFICFSKKGGELFLPKSKESVRINKIFSKFIANNCQELKNKAKLFLFCPIPYVRIRAVEHDGERLFTENEAYDIPVEADMLIVYKRLETSGGGKKFFNELGQNVIEHGKKWDMIELITNTDCQESVPLIVSTLTRKFYLISNSHRGHHLSINEHHENLSKTLETIKNRIDEKTVIKTITAVEKDSLKCDNKERANAMRKSSSSSGIDSKKSPIKKNQPRKDWKY